MGSDSTDNSVRINSHHSNQVARYTSQPLNTWCHFCWLWQPLKLVLPHGPCFMPAPWHRGVGRQHLVPSPSPLLPKDSQTWCSPNTVKPLVIGRPKKKTVSYRWQPKDYYVGKDGYFSDLFKERVGEKAHTVFWSGEGMWFWQSVYIYIYIYIYSLPFGPPSHLPPHPTPLGWYRPPVWVSWDMQQIPIDYLFSEHSTSKFFLPSCPNLTYLSWCCHINFCKVSP